MRCNNRYSDGDNCDLLKSVWREIVVWMDSGCSRDFCLLLV